MSLDIVLVDPNATVRRMMQGLLAPAGLEVLAFESLDKLSLEPPHPRNAEVVVFLGILDDIDALKHLDSQFPQWLQDGVYLIISAFDPSQIERLYPLGKRPFLKVLPRPFLPSQIIGLCRSLCPAVREGRVRLPNLLDEIKGEEEGHWSTVTALLKASSETKDYRKVSAIPEAPKRMGSGPREVFSSESPHHLPQVSPVDDLLSIDVEVEMDASDLNDPSPVGISLGLSAPKLGGSASLSLQKSWAEDQGRTIQEMSVFVPPNRLLKGDPSQTIPEMSAFTPPKRTHEQTPTPKKSLFGSMGWSKKPKLSSSLLSIGPQSRNNSELPERADNLDLNSILSPEFFESQDESSPKVQAPTPAVSAPPPPPSHPPHPPSVSRLSSVQNLALSPRPQHESSKQRGHSPFKSKGSSGRGFSSSLRSLPPIALAPLKPQPNPLSNPQRSTLQLTPNRAAKPAAPPPPPKTAPAPLQEVESQRSVETPRAPVNPVNPVSLQESSEDSHGGSVSLEEVPTTLQVNGAFSILSPRVLFESWRTQRFNGLIELHAEEHCATFVFSEGLLDWVEPIHQKYAQPLGFFLLQAGIIDEEGLQVLQREVEDHLLGEKLLREERASREQIFGAMLWQMSAYVWDLLEMSSATLIVRPNAHLPEHLGRPRLHLNPSIICFHFYRRSPQLLPPWRPFPGHRIYLNEGTIQYLRSHIQWTREEDWLLSSLRAPLTLEGLAERVEDANIPFEVVSMTLSRLRYFGVICAVPGRREQSR